MGQSAMVYPEIALILRSFILPQLQKFFLKNISLRLLHHTASASEQNSAPNSDGWANE